jgi:hypothetical protein
MHNTPTDLDEQLPVYSKNRSGAWWQNSRNLLPISHLSRAAGACAVVAVVHALDDGCKLAVKPALFNTKSEAFLL